jgi:thiamine pyrophosphokinase
MKKVLIVGNGVLNSGKFYNELSKKADFIIGVDKGAKVLLDAGVKPNLAIGDFDSFEDFEFLERAGIKAIKYPIEKDKGDTELAVDFAIKEGYEEFMFSGMLGKRIDHTLFNISLIVKLCEEGKDCMIIEELEEVYPITSETKIFHMRKGDILSLFPVDKIVYGVSTDGLKYELQDKDLFYGSTLSLSNIAEKNDILVSVKKGTVLVVIEKEK